MIKSDKQYPRYILYEFERKVKRGKASAYACPESIRPLRYVVQNATYLDAKKPFFGKMAGYPHHLRKERFLLCIQYTMKQLNIQWIWRKILRFVP